MTGNIKEDFGDLIFSYTTSAHHLEDENRILKTTISQLQYELSKYRQPALMVCDVVDIYEDKAIIRTPNGNKFLVNISLECEELRPGDCVVTEQRNLVVLKKIRPSKQYDVEKFVIIEKPVASWQDIGGLDDQIREIQEVVELPIKEPQLFRKIGIQPPKGILLYGPPGTGKTLLAKAVASSSKSTFIEMVGSELVQKFIGEGAKMVKEMFSLAREKAPSIVFIDELDAIAAKRIDIGTSGEREVQRTFMQLLAEIDGFKPLDNVKIIGCTNRHDILDPAILRPGRLDRLIEVPLPDIKGIEQIFRIHIKKMTVEPNLQTTNIFERMLGFSGAAIKSAITEAGYFAIRSGRHFVTTEDFYKAIEKVGKKEKQDKDYIKMFG
ncbi:MAG: AAA family ATPase [Candidatus Woesearchaeota archaeon]